MIEAFVSDRQLSLDLGPQFVPALQDDPLSLLNPETDTGWLEEIRGQWNDVDALKLYLILLYDDLRNNERLYGCKPNELQQALVHDLRDSIRVVGTRIRELEKDQ